MYQSKRFRIASLDSSLDGSGIVRSLRVFCVFIIFADPPGPDACRNSTGSASAVYSFSQKCYSVLSHLRPALRIAAKCRAGEVEKGADRGQSMNEHTPNKAVPNTLLRNARLARGLTLQEVADELGIPDKKQVSRWEHGTNIPRSHYRQALSDLFRKSQEE